MFKRQISPTAVRCIEVVPTDRLILSLLDPFCLTDYPPWCLHEWTENTKLSPDQPANSIIKYCEKGHFFETKEEAEHVLVLKALSE